jgi:hypothetical protein
VRCVIPFYRIYICAFPSDHSIRRGRWPPPEDYAFHAHSLLPKQITLPSDFRLSFTSASTPSSLSVSFSQHSSRAYLLCERKQTHIHKQEHNHQLPANEPRLIASTPSTTLVSIIMSQANTPVPVVESPTSENPPASQATTTRPPVNNAPVPVPNSPVLEKPAASQAATTAPPVNATPVPVVGSPVSEKPAASQTTTAHNTPIPVPDSPVLEKSTASQATTSAPPVNATPSQANSAALQAETTASQPSAATPPVLVSDGTVTAPNPTQSLIPTPIPQVSVIPASSNGTASIPREEHWRVGLCDADDIETCVR